MPNRKSIQFLGNELWKFSVESFGHIVVQQLTPLNKQCLRMPGPSPRHQKMDKYLDRVSHGRTHKKGLVICWLIKRLFADDTALLLVQIQSQSQGRAASMPRWMDGRTMASLHKRFMPHAYFPFDFLFCFGWVHNWILKHSPTTDCGPGEPPRTVRWCGCGCGAGKEKRCF